MSMGSPTTKQAGATRRPSHPELADEQIVARVLAGNVALFEILMRRSNTRIYRALRSLLRDEGEIEDAMQAVYVQAYTKLASFRSEARFSTWLTQIAINEGLGRLRRDRRHRSVSLALVEEPAMPSLEPPNETPEYTASRHELVGLLERAVDSLPESYRVVFMLREIDGLDTAETALALNVSEDVVKTRLFRARAALRGSLEKLVGSAGAEAFGFHATRCDRVVARVMREIASAQ